MSNQFLENSVNQLMKKKSVVDTVFERTVVDQRGLENPRSIKIDVYDPLGRASLIEENLRSVFRKLNGRGLSCHLSVGTATNKMYMDNFNDLILHVNERYALTNKDRFRLDRPNSDADLEDIAGFLLATFETACNYRF